MNRIFDFFDFEQQLHGNIFLTDSFQTTGCCSMSRVQGVERLTTSLVNITQKLVWKPPNPLVLTSNTTRHSNWRPANNTKYVSGSNQTKLYLELEGIVSSERKNEETRLKFTDKTLGILTSELIFNIMAIFGKVVPE